MNTGPYEVLARKHRPQTFGDLIGQEHIAQTLQNAIRSGKIAHAFLFTGIRGVGKTTAARLLARALNCTKNPNGNAPNPEPCGDPNAKGSDACGNCKDIAGSRSMDVAEIDGASNRGIDSIRELNDNVRYQPAQSRYRIYIIDEAHMVTREAFNALLKTLEEPPPHVKFIFATTAVDKFPDTIVSRCQRYDFRRIPLKQISDHLKKIAKEEEIELSDDALYLIAREAQGSMRDAESLLDRLIAYAGKEVGDRHVTEILAVTDRKTLHAVATAILAGDPKAALELVDALYEAGNDLERFSRDLLEHWRNLVVVRFTEKEPGILRELPDHELAELRRQATLRPVADLQRLFRIARQGDEELKGSEYPRFVLEMTIVRMATLEPIVPVDEVLARLDEMQRGAGVPAHPSREVRTSSAPGPPPTPRPRGDSVAESVEPPPRPRAVAERKESPPLPRVVAEREESPPPALAPAGDGTTAYGRWEEFLEFVQPRRIALYMTLSHARVVEESAGKLVLGVSAERFRRELESREALTQIETLADEFYGAQTRVRIVAIASERATATPSLSPVETVEHEAVRKAVEILGGEVREVRNRR